MRGSTVGRALISTEGSTASPDAGHDEIDAEEAGTRVGIAEIDLVLCRDPREAEQSLELTDYLVAELELRLNREKSRTTSFDQGFKFLGAIFVKDSIYLPFDRPKAEPTTLSLPLPLDLLGYLELRQRT